MHLGGQWGKAGVPNPERDLEVRRNPAGSRKVRCWEPPKSSTRQSFHNPTRQLPHSPACRILHNPIRQSCHSVNPRSCPKRMVHLWLPIPLGCQKSQQGSIPSIPSPVRAPEHCHVLAPQDLPSTSPFVLPPDPVWDRQTAPVPTTMPLWARTLQLKTRHPNLSVRLLGRARW